MLDLKIDGIPEELKKNKKWVGFTVTEGGQKIPIDPRSDGFTAYANIADPDTWGSFEDAVRLIENGICVAVGYAVKKEDGYIFIDLDNHLGKLKTEEEKEQQSKLYRSLCRAVEPFNTYMEQSISGNGVHLLARGTLDDSLSIGSSPIAPVEIYDDKFMIMTGHRLNDFDIEDNERTIGAIRIFHKRYFKPKSQEEEYVADGAIIPVSSDQKYSDEEVLRVALRDEKFNLLWNDKWDEVTDKDGEPTYSTQHFADFALIRKLIFYTGNCPTQSERLFRKSPCYLAYGKNGKWTKNEKDIKNDLAKATSTCTAVYSPMVKSGGVVAPEDLGTDTEVVAPENTSVWTPNFSEIFKKLSAEDPNDRPIQNPVLVSILKDYIVKYSGKDITYLPYLFKEDRNINGCTNIVKTAAQNRLKYSYNFGGYYFWDGQRYVDYGDSEILIHPITEVLGLVEHSVFHWVMTYVAEMENPEADSEDGEEKGKKKKDKDKEPTPKERLEGKAIKLFQDSKLYVSAKMAQDVLKKYKGMSMADDIAGYYDSPYINMQNGVLDLGTRELLPHDPIYNQSKITNCDYDPQAECPEFIAMMERLLPDQAVRKEFQKAVGLCLAKEQLPAKKALMLLVGPKDTGKSTVLNTLLDTLGEYGTSVDNSVLMQNKTDKSHGPQMYDFRENLMITTSEANEGDKLDTGRVKSLTGETMQSIKNNYATKMDKFRMIGLIFIDSNFKPYIPPKDTAAWGRLRLFPFESVIKVKDSSLKSKLEKERSGIFNWILKGLEIVLEEQEIFETSAMLDYKDQYQKEMDTTQQFVSDCLEHTESGSDRILTSILFSTYKNWCKDNGFRDSIRNKFYEEISKYFERKKSGSEYFVNVKFTPLGTLYSGMTEKTSQQFAKEKRIVLGGSDPNLGYGVLKTAYFSKSKDWFILNIKRENFSLDYGSQYSKYCEWCIDKGLIPLKALDFNAKMSYLYKNMTTQMPDPPIMEKIKNIWYE